MNDEEGPGLRDREYRYRPAWWLPGPHAQTIWGRFGRRYPRVSIVRECLTAPDGDNVEIHSLQGLPDAPRILMLHGLEGGVRSHYVGAAFAQAQRRGWSATLIVHRGCGTAPNLAPRFYHSGETSDLAFAFDTLSRRHPDANWLLAGVSLGGNILLKWLGELGDSVDRRIRAAAAVSVPFDLEAGARSITHGFARVYDHSFLKSLRRKALAKLDRYPDLFDGERLRRAASVIEFDEAVTAPVHGFRDAHDYYERSSSEHFLLEVRLPTLLLAARDDPFLPEEVIERVARLARANPAITADIQPRGGHVGFVGGVKPWRPFYYAEWRVFRYFDEAMERK